MCKQSDCSLEMRYITAWRTQQTVHITLIRCTQHCSGTLDMIDVILQMQFPRLSCLAKHRYTFTYYIIVSPRKSRNKIQSTMCFSGCLVNTWNKTNRRVPWTMASSREEIFLMKLLRTPSISHGNTFISTPARFLEG